MTEDRDPGGVSERGLFAALAEPRPAEPVERRTPRPAVAPHVRPSPAALPARLPSGPAWLQAPQRLDHRLLARFGARALLLEYDRGTAFLFVPVFMATGAVLYHALRFEPDLSVLAALAFAAALVALALRSRPWSQLAAIALLLVAAGALLGKVETLRAGTKVLGTEISTQLTGTVAEIERMANGRIRLTLDVLSTARPPLRHAPERVRISARRIPPGIAAGSTVSGLVRLLPPTGPVRPGSYDFSFESYFDGIGASGFFMRGPVLSVDAPPPRPRLSTRIENFRSAIADRIRQRIGGAEGEVAAALIVGVRAGIPEALGEAMRTAGLYHVISISGLHMALVAGTLMILLRFGFAFFPDFSARHPVKKFAALVALAGITAYLMVSGGEVAAQRSYLMLAVMLAAILVDRAALTLRNLAISAIIVVALSPHEVVGPSFQMSFAATAALVGAYAAWSEYSERRQAPPMRRTMAGRGFRYVRVALVGLAATSLVAGLATSVFAAYHFQRVSPLSLLANLAAMPIVSVVVMPSAVPAAIAMPFGLDGPFLDLMGAGIRWMTRIAEWITAHSPADAVGIVPGVSVVLLAAALAIATLCTTWLRLAAVAPAALGLLMLGTARVPDVLVSEDARLVGVAAGGGTLALNRARPNAFTVDNWQRAVDATARTGPVRTMPSDSAGSIPTPPGTVADSGRVPGIGASTAAGDAAERGVAGAAADASAAVNASIETAAAGVASGSAANTSTGPIAKGYAAPDSAAEANTPNAAGISGSAEIGGGPSTAATRRPGSHAVADSPATLPTAAAGFTCADGLCLAAHPSGLVIAHAENARTMAQTCGLADLVIVDDATVRRRCIAGGTLVITGRDLARHGAAAVFVAAEAGKRPSLDVRFSVAEPYRPWHVHRKFSRAARGLPPYGRGRPDAFPNDVNSGG